MKACEIDKVITALVEMSPEDPFMHMDLGLPGSDSYRRLRDAYEMLDQESQHHAGGMSFDAEGQRLVSQDGTWKLQYYPPGAVMPDGYTVGRKGSVRIEEN